jgi:hypothetical protein
VKRKSRDQRSGILVQGGDEEILRIMGGITSLCTIYINCKRRICIFIPSLIMIFVSKKRKVRERKDIAHLRAGRSGHVTAPLSCTLRRVLTHLLFFINIVKAPTLSRVIHTTHCSTYRLACWDGIKSFSTQSIG